MSNSLSSSRLKNFGEGGKAIMKVYALFEVKDDDCEKGELDTSKVFLNEDDAVKELCNVSGCWYIEELEVKV